MVLPMALWLEQVVAERETVEPLALVEQVLVEPQAVLFSLQDYKDLLSYYYLS